MGGEALAATITVLSPLVAMMSGRPELVARSMILSLHSFWHSVATSKHEASTHDCSGTLAWSGGCCS